MKPTATVEEYVQGCNASQKAEFMRIRGIVKDLAPDAEETISYGIPTFKVKGKPLLHFGAFKEHMSLFPTSTPIGVLQDKLSKYTVAKGTIQFTEDNLLPEALIKDILAVRLAQINQK